MRLNKKVLHRAILSSLSCAVLSLPIANIMAEEAERPPEWPVGLKDISVTYDNQPITIPVLDNDIGVGLTLISVNDWSANLGRAEINPDGKTISYHKLGDPDTWPEADTFWYVFADAWGRTNAAKVEIILGEPEGQAWPGATTDVASTTVNTATNIDVLANDTGLGLRLKSVNASSVRWGRITIVGDQLNYVPYTDFSGQDEFWYVMENIHGQTNAAKVIVNVNESVVIEGGQLNDTGVTLCADYAYGTSEQHNNDLSSCAGTDAQGDPIPLGQDATIGRDTTDNDDSDGAAGFSFTKLSATGQALAADASTWSCVKDNVTGLVWENKAGTTLGIGAAGLHSADDKYTYYNTDTATNGGVTSGTQNAVPYGRCHGYVNGQPETYCNTEAFVNRVNEATLCGLSNWRLPNMYELQSIVNYDGRAPSIDTAYFPDTQYATYISSDMSVRSDNYVKGVAFYDAHILTQPKGSYSAVRLVSRPSLNVVTPDTQPQ